MTISAVIRGHTRLPLDKCEPKLVNIICQWKWVFPICEISTETVTKFWATQNKEGLKDCTRYSCEIDTHSQLNI